MSAVSAPIATLERLWNREPDKAIRGGGSDVSAALWCFEGGRIHDVIGEPDDLTNIISVPFQGRSSTVYFADGKERYNRALVPFLMNIVPAGERPRAIVQGEETFSYLHIYIPQAMLCELAGVQSGAGSPVTLIDPQGAHDSEVARVARLITDEMRNAMWLSRMAIDATSISLSIHLLRQYSNRDLVRGGYCSGSYARDWRVRRAVELLEARLSDDLRLEEVAVAVDVSPSHLLRLFRQATGEPPHRWLMRRRIKRACELLADPRESITQIAHDCGFASSQHFATVFRRHVGTTPSDFRRERLS